jgi:hypothetical protein
MLGQFGEIILNLLAQFRFHEVVLFDFEFQTGNGDEPGERPKPVCLVAHELRSGRVWRLWRDEFGVEPPYPTGPDVLFVAYYASAEVGCCLALGWPAPLRLLDLFVEFRNLTNGLETPAGSGLVGALVYFGLPLPVADKDTMRAEILKLPPDAPRDESKLDYCQEDVVGLEQLLPVMLPRVDLPRALLRGRYMVAAARMEWAGIPIDFAMLDRLRFHWDGIKIALIGEIDAGYDVYVDGRFSSERFAAWLVRSGIPWPRLNSGRLDLSDETFRQMARVYPAVAPLRELRASLSELRLHDLAVGRDGRNRCILSVFRARSSRNQPSNSKFIFGPAVWIRGLIKSPPGYAVAYIDWGQQEFGIAAALSQDPAMQAAYESGDPYLAFAKQAGAIPPDGTKTTHGPVRELYKTASLAVLYGMGERGLALRLGEPPIVAANLLAAHRQVYRRFWQWSDAAVDHAVLTGFLSTVFGWTVHIKPGFNARSLRNFPMQANGAEMLRLACCLATERFADSPNIDSAEVCAPVHDALLICAHLSQIDDAVAVTRAAMAEASRIVLAGFELRTDVNVVRWPDRYMDPRGARMWEIVNKLVSAADHKQGAAA